MEEKRNYSRRYTKEYNNVFRKIYYLFFTNCICKPFFWFFFNIKFYGIENIPKDRRVIFAPNHISYLDPPAVGCILNRQIAFMAKKELFENKKLRRRIDWLGAFAVNREKPEVSTIKTVRDIMNTDWNLGIFPQGGIKLNRKIEDINKGFAWIAKTCKCDIVPIAITGCEGFGCKDYDTKVKLKPFYNQLNIQIAPVIKVEGKELDEIIHEWSSVVSQLCDYEYEKPEKFMQNI